jgi:hypothetical protein
LQLRGQSVFVHQHDGGEDSAGKVLPEVGMAAESASKEQYLKISRPRNDCLLCSRPLNVDGKHPSLIEISSTEEAIRKDFCPECWERMREQGYFSFWLTKRVNEPSPEERRLAKADRNEALWRLFSALYASGEGELAPQLFFLAHLLMKYKVLAYAGPGKDGRLMFHHPKLGETFEIEDVPLDSADFAEIRRQVEQQAVGYAGQTQGAQDADFEEPAPQ